MAGTKLVLINFTDREKIGALLQGLRERAADSQGVLEPIGDLLLESTAVRFDVHAGPDGTRWSPVSPQYAGRKAGGKATKRSSVSTQPSDTLVLSGDLRDGIAFQIEAGVLFVGTNRPYGATHQFGRGNIPARPFLGLSKEDEEAIIAILEDHLLPPGS